MIDENLVDALLSNYIYQKKELLERAGHRGVLDTDRLESLMRPRIAKMAAVIEDWDIQPDIIMAAVFDWARRNRHPDGPMPNMLASTKYLMKALSNYMQIPYEVVADKRCKAMFLENRDFEYKRFKKELDGAGVTDLSSATSYPVEVRYLMALTKFDFDACFYMAQELLGCMKSDKRILMWLEHRGVTYEGVAKHFNETKKKYDHQRQN